MNMFIHLSRINKFCLLFLLSFSIEIAFASHHTEIDSATASYEESNRATFERDDIRTEKGMIMMDYQVIPVPDIESIDLLGLHYFHQFNDWLYLGVGLHAPLVHGNYGGFMAFDTTIHTQRKIYKDIFINAGVSLGGGGGGSSIDQSSDLSGTGGFIKSYIGLGYEFPSFSVGVNYTDFRFKDSLINHAQANIFIQKPFSYSLGSYARSGNKRRSDRSNHRASENIVTLEANNIFQIDPAGTKTKLTEGTNTSTINTLSLQFSHFLTNKHYLFFGGDVGYKGIPIYNQAIGGMGYRFSASPRVNFYTQIGIGSGGYSPEEIDTGSGLLVYPKFSAEYLLSKNLGLSLSGGYLYAPTGSSKNYTLGAGLNYYLSTNQKNRGIFSPAKDSVYKGFRFHTFAQTEFDVEAGNRQRNDINMLSAQFDYLLNDNWYLALRGGVAYNEFLGFPGYGEILAGVGIQNKFSPRNKFQNFFQLNIGANVLGIVLKPSIGINYTLSDDLALYAEVGKTITLYDIDVFSNDEGFSSYSIGLGITNRFSLL